MVLSYYKSSHPSGSGETVYMFTTHGTREMQEVPKGRIGAEFKDGQCLTKEQFVSMLEKERSNLEGIVEKLKSLRYSIANANNDDSGEDEEENGN